MRVASSRLLDGISHQVCSATRQKLLIVFGSAMIIAGHEKRGECAGFTSTNDNALWNAEMDQRIENRAMRIRQIDIEELVGGLRG